MTVADLACFSDAKEYSAELMVLIASWDYMDVIPRAELERVELLLTFIRNATRVK